jgi:uridine kinase
VRQTGPVRARMIVLAGPSGAGKSRLAERVGLPVLRLDDFYKSAGDPTLPLITSGANAGLVDWDHPDSWLPDDAMAAIESLCETGRAEVPVYEIAQDGRCGWQTLELGPEPLFVAEGIFAQEIVPRSRAEGRLAAAYCVRQHPAVTFWRRLTRDLREHRKPPLVLVRRGLALLHAQRRVVQRAVELGCTPVSPDEAWTALRALVADQAPR